MASSQTSDVLAQKTRSCSPSQQQPSVQPRPQDLPDIRDTSPNQVQVERDESEDLCPMSEGQNYRPRTPIDCKGPWAGDFHSHGTPVKTTSLVLTPPTTPTQTGSPVIYISENSGPN